MTATIHPITEAATFEDFWSLVYHKVNRVLCEAKWEAITNGGLETRMLDKDSGMYVKAFLKATPEEIIAGQKRMMKHWPVNADYSLKDAQYMMRPAQFLNRGGWLDG